MLEVRNLTIEYDRFRAVDDISFSVGPESGITALLGPNGAGKTTTMRAITGYLHPTSGRVIVDGIERTDTKSDLQIKRSIGYLPESTPLYNEMLVSEFIEFSGRARGLSQKDGSLEKAARDMIDRLDIGSHFYTPLGLLSKGFRQRVGLAATLLHDPKVIILDEPTSGLDPNQIQSIRSLIKELGKDRTLIMSTHILQEVDDVCERAIVIHRGKIVADRKVADLKESHRYVLVVKHSAGIEDILNQSGMTRSVEVSPADDGFQRYTFSLNQKPEAFFETIRNQPFEIREFAPMSKSMNEIFAELTQWQSGQVNHAD